MRTTTSLLAIVLSALTAAATANPALAPRQTREPDPPATFIAELFDGVADCSGTTGIHAFLYSRGACQNIAIPGAGSAHVRFNSLPDELSLTGWTGADCTGDSIEVGAVVGECVALDGVDVASWSY
ncbi:hypothetical protein MGN70_003768 [Eutypa lata]|uniref:Uncharacterized protein n=1 Tax=Eutypa lata (strain UCR-EL1) TaxID=1287681 RepID=M7SNC2_EUTLA|nr:hypothetical protein UCREL1_7085 [Eutypa lata UCREL1]KAI1254753.1 hypothetical protein MGN70_003768 [Eutypa lata]